jgi:hypothetical protein
MTSPSRLPDWSERDDETATQKKFQQMPESKPDPKCVWVSNLPLNWGEDDFKKTFEQYGPIDRIDLPSGPKGRKPYAFLHFVNPEDAAKAIAQGDGMSVADRILCVRAGAAPRMSGHRDSRPSRPLPPGYSRSPPRLPPRAEHNDRYADDYYRYPPVRRDIYEDQRFLQDGYPDRRRFDDAPPRFIEAPRRFDDRILRRPPDDYLPPRDDYLPPRDRDPDLR